MEASLATPPGVRHQSMVNYTDHTVKVQCLGYPGWYCARTQPKHEHIAAAGLARKLGLEVFHPRLRLERAKQRGIVRVVEPLFPGYVFVRCLSHLLQEVRYVNGVSSLVQFGPSIPVVPDAVIDELKLCFESEEPVAVRDSLYPGAEVTVAGGAFLGSRGLVVRLIPARQRVQILLEFLGRTTVAELDRSSVILENGSMAGLVPFLASSAHQAAQAAA
jgi:transcriptional antiterminator RfaH